MKCERGCFLSEMVLYGIHVTFFACFIAITDHTHYYYSVDITHTSSRGYCRRNRCGALFTRYVQFLSSENFDIKTERATTYLPQSKSPDLHRVLS